MAPSHSFFVGKLTRGTVPHGIAHTRSSLGHRILHEHSAPAAAPERRTATAASRPAKRPVTAPATAGLHHNQREASESGTRRGGTMKR